LRNIPFKRKKLLEVSSKGKLPPSFYKAVCFESAIVECKSQSSIGLADDAQVINYLALTPPFKKICVHLRKSAAKNPPKSLQKNLRLKNPFAFSGSLLRFLLPDPAGSR